MDSKEQIANSPKGGERSADEIGDQIANNAVNHDRLILTASDVREPLKTPRFHFFARLDHKIRHKIWLLARESSSRNLVFAKKRGIFFSPNTQLLSTMIMFWFTVSKARFQVETFPSVGKQICFYLPNLRIIRIDHDQNSSLPSLAFDRNQPRTIGWEEEVSRELLEDEEKQLEEWGFDPSGKHPLIRFGRHLESDSRSIN
ncbi:hypothetical protein HYALB_00002195 [Hymenoscyphus albidus]|uniref:Uncharacterized protein n=1 Tax=Hymenoscyphus albidus TaxID=595503 RepID=A0A9N9LI89_9HELO|nr:hypothetical protein HYALB_00002195 [Hymenoscyphus albidus]